MVDASGMFNTRATAKNTRPYGTSMTMPATIGFAGDTAILMAQATTAPAAAAAHY